MTSKREQGEEKGNMSFQAFVNFGPDKWERKRRGI
jgi:hypothetical protein